MFNKLTSYFLGSSEELQQCAGETAPPPLPPTSEDKIAVMSVDAAVAAPTTSELSEDNPKLKQTEVEGDDWILVDHYAEGSGGVMEESWFVTPPACFTRSGPVHVETSPLENLLIEHPSMSVYAGAMSLNNSSSATANTSISSDTTLIEPFGDTYDDSSDFEMELHSWNETPWTQIVSCSKRRRKLQISKILETEKVEKELRRLRKLELGLDYKMSKAEWCTVMMPKLSSIYSTAIFIDDACHLSSQAPAKEKQQQQHQHQQQRRQQKLPRRRNFENQENKELRPQQRSQTNVRSDRQRQTANNCMRDSGHSSADENERITQIRSTQKVLQKRNTQFIKRNFLDRSNKVREVANCRSRPRRQDRLRLNNSFANNNRKC